MSTKSHYPQVNIAQAKRQIAAAIDANRVALLVGNPGCGKTAVMAEVAHEHGLKLVSLLGSTLDPTDVGGFPVVSKDGALDRIPMRAIREAAAEPCLLFHDELSCCTKPVEAALLRGLHEGVFGDVKIHPESRQVAACNDPEQAPGGFEFSSPLVGRMAIYEFCPTFDEVRTYFNERLGAEGSQDPVAPWARDWAATCYAKPDLITFDPPQASLTEGSPWGAPRSWERGLRMVAAVGNDPDDQFFALAASVGLHSAQAYLAIRKLREFLPTVAEVCRVPASCQLPAGRDKQIGVLGLLATVATQDCWAAWIYASRCEEEIAQAAAHALGPRNVAKAPNKHAAEGVKARNRLLGRIGARLGA